MLAQPSRSGRSSSTTRTSIDSFTSGDWFSGSLASDSLAGEYSAADSWVEDTVAIQSSFGPNPAWGSFAFSTTLTVPRPDETRSRFSSDQLGRVVVRWEARDVGNHFVKCARSHGANCRENRALCQEKMLHNCRNAWRERFTSNVVITE